MAVNRQALLKNLEFFGKRVEGGVTVSFCPICERTFNQALPDDGHASDCQMNEAVNKQQRGGIRFTRESAAHPNARGCNTCKLANICILRGKMDSALTEHRVTARREDHLLPAVPNPGPLTNDLMNLSHLAEACQIWEERE